MQKVGNFWVPDVDMAPGKNSERTRAAYENGEGIQISHLNEGLEHLDRFTVAIDGGANVGSWAKVMADHFGKVYAFEPSAETYACLSRNVEEWGLSEKIVPLEQALSDEMSMVSVGSGATARTVTRRITGAGNTPAVTIDSLELEECSFVKLDLEGHEAKAIKGAARTLAAHKPWVLIEYKPKMNAQYGQTDDPVELLKSTGYALHARLGERGIDWLFRPAS